MQPESLVFIACLWACLHVCFLLTCCLNALDGSMATPVRAPLRGGRVEQMASHASQPAGSSLSIQCRARIVRQNLPQRYARVAMYANSVCSCSALSSVCIYQGRQCANG